MKAQKTVLFLSGCLLLALVVASAVYAVYGHSFIAAIYEGRSFGVLNSLIEGQAAGSLEIYQERGDVLFFISLFFALAGIFGLVIFKLRPPFSDRTNWLIAGGIVFFIISAAYLRPAFGENELVYFIHPKKLAFPGFLSSDWTWQKPVYSHLLYDLLLSPLMPLFDTLTLALLGRVSVWLLLIFALVQLARTLQISWWGFMPAFAFWFYSGQALAAEEWVFGGVEAKCFSYIFLFFALVWMLQGKIFRAAVFGGIATSFHVLVGGWGSVGLLAGLWPALGEKRLSKIVLFCLAVLVPALPGILSSVFNVFQSGGMSQGNYAIDVFFRGPHHMDPKSFLSISKLAEIGLYYFAALFLMMNSFHRKHASILAGFLTAQMAVFGAGILAREMNWLFFLYLYPFRVAALILPLFFWLSLFHFLKLNFHSPRGRTKVLWGAVSFFCLIHLFRYAAVEKLWKSTADSVISWKHYLRGGEEDGFREIADWIKTHTPPGSIFAAPPWEYRFWLLAERAQVANFKTIPANASNEAWMNRMIDLNGGRSFQEKGGRALNELKENFPQLSSARLLDLKGKYGAGYYLVTQKRKDLAFPLVHSAGTYYLYDLS